jgi:hypothetical protein
VPEQTEQVELQQQADLEELPETATMVDYMAVAVAAAVVVAAKEQLELYGVQVDPSHQQIQQTYKELIKCGYKKKHLAYLLRIIIY